jgi:hypothetical protein
MENERLDERLNERLDASGMRLPGAMPGAQASAILLLDGLLTLMRLGKAEALQALETLPQLLSLSLYRLPALLLTWLSFGALVASGVYAATDDSAVYAAGSFFLLQLGLTVMLERRARLLHRRMEFPQTRQGLAVLQASLKERFDSEAE